ncbi:peptidoglycan bridge formation glycyltransferase FemA/FemB family protein [Microcoleus sp. T3_A4]|uniref:FemAB family protein n=1 Tax=Microcoleus sp. T3_A4 TaxID=2818968 RepID=UPI002FD242FB
MNTQIIDLTDNLWLETLSKLRHDIYHLPEYVYLESLRNKAAAEAILIFEADKIFFLPYFGRHCDGLVEENLATEDFFDVVSPYGYPGIVLSEAAAKDREFVKLAMNQLISALRAKGVCSAFFRLHPILNQGFEEILDTEICKITGETISIDLRLSEAKIWQQTQKSQRKQISRCKRDGFTARMVPLIPYVDEFTQVYHETMRRASSVEYYYSFDSNYFLQLAEALGEKLHLCLIELNNQIASAGLYTECCGIVQSTFGGTRTKFLKQSPNSLRVDYARSWAKERGNDFLHLGGGVGSYKDGVYNFKATFSEQRHNFLTMRLILDEEKYRYLVKLRAKSLNTETEELLNSNFFPAYRSIDSGWKKSTNSE